MNQIPFNIFALYCENVSCCNFIYCILIATLLLCNKGSCHVILFLLLYAKHQRQSQRIKYNKRERYFFVLYSYYYVYFLYYYHKQTINLKQDEEF